MKIAILGLGREGKSVLKYLKKTSPRLDIKILDRKFDKNYLKNLSDFDVVFRSPGVPYNLPEIQKAVKKGARFSSATKLFFNETQKIGCKIIGITGTKGKGTTATLLYKILKICNKNVFLAGNIGKSAVDLLPKISKNSIVILELSSFQLQDMEKSPDITVVLDIFPDHMDAHKNLQEYFNAKANIAKYQKRSDKIFYIADNKHSKWIASKSRGKKIVVQCRDIRCPDIKKIFGTSDVQKLIKMPGFHNLKNAVMAATVALSLGCPKEKIIKVVKNFKGNEHRLELVRTIRVNPLLKNKNPRISASIKFYNDSASTNPQTAAVAIKSFKELEILIAGGKDKGLNYLPLAQALKNSNTELVILFGENKNKIRKQISNTKCQVKLVKDLKSSVNLAYKEAKNLAAKKLNSVIIFSPAAASFDMFKDYADRGRKFKELVRKLK